MRWFFRRRIPAFGRILLVESGDRSISERLLPLMQRNHGSQVRFDLVTCYPGLPEGYPAEGDGGECTLVFRTNQAADRRALLREIAARNYRTVGLICSGEPILFRWKSVLAARLRAKVFIVNENADYFFLDYSNAKTIFRLALDRAGLAGPSAARNLANLALFPFSLAFLLAYAAWAHSLRLVRKPFLKI